VNDTYGHATGDIVLQRLAETLKQQVRAIDTVGRYGGEEFMMLMPNTSSENAARVVNRIREAVARMSIQSTDGRSFQVTFSAGVAPATLKNAQDQPLASAEAFRQSVESADRLLYQAKEQGRNRVVSQ